MPKVSVIMSCYNAEKFLEEAIESILGQTFKEFEFILIDDGSTDATLEIIKKYARIDRRIVVIEKENTGQAHSANIGIDIAQGEWIARLDADDIALPERLKKQVEFLERHHNILLLGSACVEINELGQELKVHRYPTTHWGFIRELEKGKSPFPHSSAIFKTEVARKIGGYRVRMTSVEDLDLWLRLSEEGSISCIQEPLIKLRKHAMSVSARSANQVILSYASRISYFLRRAKCEDPIDQDEMQFNQFLSWIEERLAESGFFEIRDMWKKARLNYYAAASKIDGAISAAFVILRSKHRFRIIRERFFGSSLPKLLAEEWMQNNCKIDRSG